MTEEFNDQNADDTALYCPKGANSTLILEEGAVFYDSELGQRLRIVCKLPVPTVSDF